MTSYLVTFTKDSMVCCEDLSKASLEKVPDKKKITYLFARANSKEEAIRKSEAVIKELAVR